MTAAVYMGMPAWRMKPVKKVTGIRKVDHCLSNSHFPGEAGMRPGREPERCVRMDTGLARSFLQEVAGAESHPTSPPALTPWLQPGPASLTWCIARSFYLFFSPPPSKLGTSEAHQIPREVSVQTPQCPNSGLREAGAVPPRECSDPGKGGILGFSCSLWPA